MSSPAQDSGSLRLRLMVLLVLGIAAAVALSPSPAATMPDEVRIPMKAPREEYDPQDAALFSHWAHNQYYCYTCHPSIFPQRRVTFTHEDLDAGRYCARCHDGKVAFHYDGDDIECELCHREPAWKVRRGAR